MSQRSEKLHRKVDRLENQVAFVANSFEEHLARVEYEFAFQENVRNKAHRDRQYRRELESEYAAKHWQTVAYAAIIAAILVLIVAIAAVRAKAAEPQAPVDELKISASETITHSEDDAKNTPVFVTSLEQIMDSYEIVEDFENEKIEAALLERATEIQNCTVTHYCICKECCGKDPDHPAYGITASGLRASPYVSIAVDPDVIPLGSDVLVDYGDGELHYYRAEDTGSAVKGDHIDVCVSSHEEAQQLGITTATVYYAAPEEV